MAPQASSSDAVPTPEGTGGSSLEPYIDDATRKGLISRYGPDWVAALPSVIERLTREHGWLPRKRLTGGRTACVLLMESAGQSVVVKVTPDLRRSSCERAALYVMASWGVGPRVLDHWLDREGAFESSVVIMEALGDGASLRNEPRAHVPVRALADLLSALQECGVIALDAPLESLMSHLEWRLEKPRGGGLHGARPPTLAEMLGARALLHDLATSIDSRRWVHGTLHPGNLIMAGEKILAIDPRPFYGDFEYDVAELAIKWGSERASRQHNYVDGFEMWQELKSFLDANEEKVIAWMRVILATGV